MISYCSHTQALKPIETVLKNTTHRLQMCIVERISDEEVTLLCIRTATTLYSSLTSLWPIFAWYKPYFSYYPLIQDEAYIKDGVQHSGERVVARWADKGHHLGMGMADSIQDWGCTFWTFEDGECLQASAMKTWECLQASPMKTRESLEAFLRP